MRASNVTKLLVSSFQTGNNRPVFIWGPPGVGKSDTVRRATNELGVGLIDLRMSLLDVTDLRGFPVPRENKAVWLVPVFLPDVARDGERGILFLDELNAAAPLVQTSAYQLILDRKVGEYVLPEHWTIVAAGNRQSDRGNIHRMAAPLESRFSHIDFGQGFCQGAAGKHDVEDWVGWAAANGISEEVIAFIMFRPELLFQFDPKRDEHAFPTPRTWAMADRWLKIGDEDIVKEVVAGTVGKGACTEFWAFRSIRKDLPDIDGIRAGRVKTIPVRKDVLYATVAALALRSEVADLRYVLPYGCRLDAEVAVVMFTLMMVGRKLGPEMVKVPEFQKWMIEYGPSLAA